MPECMNLDNELMDQINARFPQATADVNLSEYMNGFLYSDLRSFLKKCFRVNLFSSLENFVTFKIK